MAIVAAPKTSAILSIYSEILAISKLWPSYIGCVMRTYLVY